MPPSVSIGLIVLGGVLLLVAILGGNFSIFGANVGHTISSWQLRLLAGVLGIGFELVVVLQSFPSIPVLLGSLASSPKAHLPAAAGAAPVTPPAAATNPRPADGTPAQPNTSPLAPGRDSTLTAKPTGGPNGSTNGSTLAHPSLPPVATREVPAAGDLKRWWDDVTTSEVARWRKSAHGPLHLYSPGCKSGLAFDSKGRVFESKMPGDLRIFGNSDKSLSLLALNDGDYGLAMDNGLPRMKRIPDSIGSKDDLPLEFRFRILTRESNYGESMSGSDFAKGCTVAPSLIMRKTPRLIEPLAYAGRVLTWSPPFALGAPPEQIGPPVDFEKKAAFLVFLAPPD